MHKLKFLAFFKAIFQIYFKRQCRLCAAACGAGQFTWLPEFYLLSCCQQCWHNLDYQNKKNNNNKLQLQSLAFVIINHKHSNTNNKYNNNNNKHKQDKYLKFIQSQWELLMTMINSSNNMQQQRATTAHIQYIVDYTCKLGYVVIHNSYKCKIHALTHTHTLQCNELSYILATVCGRYDNQQ